MEMPLPEEVSYAEREGILWDATRRYLRGEISAQELQEIEDRYSLYTRKTIVHVPQAVSYPATQEKSRPKTVLFMPHYSRPSGYDEHF